MGTWPHEYKSTPGSFLPSPGLWEDSKCGAALDPWTSLREQASLSWTHPQPSWMLALGTGRTQAVPLFWESYRKEFRSPLKRPLFLPTMNLNVHMKQKQTLLLTSGTRRGMFELNSGVR